MKSPLYLYLIIFIFCHSCGVSKSGDQSHRERVYYDFAMNNNVLVGKIPITQITQSNGRFVWFDENYAKYNVKDSIANKLKPYLRDIEFEIFLGTWCGDTKRTFPKIIKILTHTNYNINDIDYYALDKQKKGLTKIAQQRSINYVPTIIVYRNGKELNRIVESHVVSIEADLLNILTANSYRHYYDQ